MQLTSSFKAFLWAGLTCVALVACGGGGDGPVTSDNGDKTDSSDSPSNKDSSVNMCTGTMTSACECSNGMAGRRTCKNGAYGGCVCGANGDTKDGGTKPTSSLCKAGYYTGAFTGVYNPGFAGFGIVPSGFQVMISGTEANGIPALAFTLNENSMNVGEFLTFTVGNGCMQGSAQAFGVVNNPFVARITGTLDCGTGYFEGHLDGQYQLLGVSPIPSLFSGPLTAQFTLPQSLTDGEWNVMEPPSLSGGAMGGGMGTWNADWSAADAPATTTDPCAAISMLIDGGVPAPGDTTTTPPTTTVKPDAGTP